MLAAASCCSFEVSAGCSVFSVVATEADSVVFFLGADLRAAFLGAAFLPAAFLDDFFADFFADFLEDFFAPLPAPAPRFATFFALFALVFDFFFVLFPAFFLAFFLLAIVHLQVSPTITISGGFAAFDYYTRCMQ
jgi:hypothetical protein